MMLKLKMINKVSNPIMEYSNIISVEYPSTKWSNIKFTQRNVDGSTNSYTTPINIGDKIILELQDEGIDRNTDVSFDDLAKGMARLYSSNIL